jgi:hypothetical protein
MTTHCSIAEYVSRQVRRMRRFQDVDPSRARNIRFFLVRWIDDHGPDYPEFHSSLALMMDVTTEDLLGFTVLFGSTPALASLRYRVSVVPTFGGFYTRVEGDNAGDACRAVQKRMQIWLTSAVADVRAVEEIYVERQAA